MMTGFLKPFVLTIVVLSLVSCAFREDTEEIRYLKAKQDVENGLEKVTFKRSEIRAEFIPGAHLNEYSAKVIWPKGRPVYVRVAQNNKVLNTFERDSENSIVVQCIERFLRISIETLLDSGEVTSTHEIGLSCPTDFKVDVNSAATDLPVGLNGRLVFGPSGVLNLRETDNLKLRLSSIEVESGVGKIKVQSPLQSSEITADLFNKGLPQISIIATKATGALRFELNGIDGGPGSENTEQVAADPAKNGSPGSAGVIDPNGFCRRVGPRGDPSLDCRATCVTHPTSGTPGRDGVPSTVRGGAGQPGIGTSPVSLLVDQPKDFRVTFVFNPGRGGDGGKGGLGQPGGQPGAPGANPQNVCPAAPAAAAGATGGRGPFGYQGPDGGCGRLTLTSALKGLIELIDKRSECSRTTNLIKFVD